MTPAEWLVPITLTAAIVSFSVGWVASDYRHARAEQARRDEQQTNEKETQ